MNPEMKIPPKSPSDLTSPDVLADRLRVLIGHPFPITGATRKIGSDLRKLVSSTLENHGLPDTASESEYEIVPTRKKGVPKILREFIDTYVVTTGTSYNLQVWNRVPASTSLLIKYESGESLRCCAVRFVLVRVDTATSEIASILVLSAEYIESRFGWFGKPTVKHQLMISSKARQRVCTDPTRILSYPDSKKLSYRIRHDYSPPNSGMVMEPGPRDLFSIELLRELVAEKLIGMRLDAAATKNRGQNLERMTLALLGYTSGEKDLLHGGFPDIRNQMLEVKVQDSQTVDLGRFSPEHEEVIIEDGNITTFDIRYLIALTDPSTGIIEGVILAPGERLGELFSYISAQSYKCQRSIPMAFFEKYRGMAVFNPD